VTATARAVELAGIAAEAAAEKLAADIIAYDVSEQLVITDVFLKRECVWPGSGRYGGRESGRAAGFSWTISTS
jgi:hypothetical protein